VTLPSVKFKLVSSPTTTTAFCWTGARSFAALTQILRKGSRVHEAHEENQGTRHGRRFLILVHEARVDWHRRMPVATVGLGGRRKHQV
jgi:hypothetical protein